MVLQRHMAVTAMDAVGSLLLLQLASEKVLAIPFPVPGSLYTLPSLFIVECLSFLEFTLWGPTLAACSPGTAARPWCTSVRKAEGYGLAPTSQVEETSRMSAWRPSQLQISSGANVEVAATKCRRDGVSTLCNVVSRLVQSIVTLIRREEAMGKSAGHRASSRKTSTGKSGSVVEGGSSTKGTGAPSALSITLPPHLASGIQTLERLVDDLADVVQVLVQQYKDIACAAQVISILTTISTKEGVALANVGRHCYALLQQWSGVRVIQPDDEGGIVVTTTTTDAAPQLLSQHTLVAIDMDKSNSELFDVVRISMESRNKSIMRQYAENPDDASTAALLKDTLREILRVATTSPANTTTANNSNGAGGGREAAIVDAAVTQHLMCMAPELLQLVACCSRQKTRSIDTLATERELRQLLSYTLQALFSNNQCLASCAVTGTPRVAVGVHARSDLRGNADPSHPHHVAGVEE